MPSPRLNRTFAALALASLLALAAGPRVLAAPTDPRTDGPAPATAIDTTSVIVHLTGEPLATSPQADRADGRVVLNGKKTAHQRATLAQQRNTLRAWLRTNAPRAQVTVEYDFGLNAVAVRLNGTAADALRAAPGVTEVEYQETFAPDAVDTSLALINALEGWAAAGATSAPGDPGAWAGAGVRIGIVDTGIDASHPCFSDAGYPSQARVGDPRFTNNKVIAARVFGNQVKRTGATPADFQGHGTHVAGIAACNLATPATVSGAEIPGGRSGVAPGALLGNYNVFPGLSATARTEDIVDALESAAEDGMDVITLALSGDGISGRRSLGTNVIDNLDRAGIVVTASVGNGGPGPGTLGSPGSAERALTVGASSVGHYVGLPVSASGGQVSVGAIGVFPTPATDLTGPLAVLRDDQAVSQACGELAPGSLAGSVALVSRGGCAYSDKVVAAAAAGAVAVLVLNDRPGDPEGMGVDGPVPDLPAVMVPLGDAPALLALDGDDVTLGVTPTYRASGNDNWLLPYSAWGPTSVDFRVKPDVVAPGGAVISAAPGWGCPATPESCWIFLSGASMATAHAAGMAAVVRDAHQTWEAWQVRSAIVNTADADGVLSPEGGAPLRDVRVVGAGLGNLADAVGATLTLSRPSVSFGAVPSGAGATRTETLTVTNVSGGPVTLAPTIAGDGVFTANAGATTLAAGASTTVTVTLSLPRFAGESVLQGQLWLDDQTHAAVFVQVR